MSTGLVKLESMGQVFRSNGISTLFWVPVNYEARTPPGPPNSEYMLFEENEDPMRVSV